MWPLHKICVVRTRNRWCNPAKRAATLVERVTSQTRATKPVKRARSHGDGAHHHLPRLEAVEEEGVRDEVEHHENELVDLQLAVPVQVVPVGV